MSYHRLAYEDADRTAEMRLDCDRVVQRLGLRRSRSSIADRAVGPAPSILFDDNRREIVKREIQVSDAAARLASALHLHLD